jgi:hypothetical protein
MFELISKKFTDIKILHQGYTADYFLNRMKTTALFPTLFIQNNLLKKKKNRYRHFLSDYCTVCILEKFYRVIFCFLVLIGQYLSRNWLLNEGNNQIKIPFRTFSNILFLKIQSPYSYVFLHIHW